MSFLKNVFGGGKKGGANPPKSSAADQTMNALQQLIEKEELQEKRKEHIEKQIQNEVDKAKEFIRNGKKSNAESCLQKKKLYEQQLKQVNTAILRLNEQRITLEGARSTAEALSVMKQAAQATKQQMKEVNIENVDDLIDEIQQTNDELRQLNEVMAQPLGTNIDMDEVEDELNALQDQVTEDQLLKAGPTPTHVPAGYQNKNKKQEVTVDDELAALEKELNKPMLAQ